MSIVGVGGNSAASQSGSSVTTSNQDPTIKAFLDYMKETPAQKMEDAWLQSHGLTRKDLEKMSPEKRQAIMKQMAEDIKQQMASKTQKPNGTAAT